ncbi:MAG TPA: helix-turn-helix transcriptional regulator [Thermomicrobiales bacterium]|nr:helix-turn-helix transcriptional regulator [Thermomicrobiales bacterium]
MNLDEYIAKRLADDPEFRAAYEASRPEFEFRRQLIRARLNARLTLEQLAERIGTKRSSISRLEGRDAEPSFDMLRQLSAALNVSFEILPTSAIVIHEFDPVHA